MSDFPLKCLLDSMAKISTIISLIEHSRCASTSIIQVSACADFALRNFKDLAVHPERVEGRTASFHTVWRTRGILDRFLPLVETRISRCARNDRRREIRCFRMATRSQKGEAPL